MEFFFLCSFNPNIEKQMDFTINSCGELRINVKLSLYFFLDESTLGGLG